MLWLTVLTSRLSTFWHCYQLISNASAHNRFTVCFEAISAGPLVESLIMYNDLPQGFLFTIFVVEIQRYFFSFLPSLCFNQNEYFWLPTFFKHSLFHSIVKVGLNVSFVCRRSSCLLTS